MSSKNNQNLSENENLCVLCFKNVEIYSVGICDHPVCYECSTRMRVLCKQNECPICRADIPKVIFTKTVEPFASLFPKYTRINLQDIKFGLIFESHGIEKAYNKLLEHRCLRCPDWKSCVFKTFGQLKDHMRREHELFYCDICVENVMIFSTERRTYTRQELGMHRRKGDPDNTSHRGHPLCEFCDTRFMDSDELYRHLRKTHLYCHFCDADGKHLYYKCIEDLKKHFREEHYLCEEGECKTIPMASAFRTEIDFKAHFAATHSRNLGKNATKQMRTLELAFTLAPRNNTRKRQGDDSRVDEEGAVGYEPGGPGGGQDLFHNPLTPMDFPALGSTSGTAVPDVRSQSAFPAKSFPKRFSDDFPSLGNSSSSRPSSAVTITTNRNSEVSISRKPANFPALGKPPQRDGNQVMLSVHNNQDKKAPQVSIQVNHKPNGSFHTQITTTAASNRNNQNQKPVEAFPALGGPSKAKEPQWVQVKSKKQPAEKPSKVATAPQLPPSDLTQFPNLSKGKTNKKTSSIQVPVTTDWVNLNSLRKEQNNNKTNDAKKKDAEVPKETLTNEKNEEKKKKKKGKPSENNVKTTDEPLENGKIPKPPPGFKLPPPPGFENRITDFPCLGVPNDLTFTTSSGRSYSITSIANNYKQPSNFSTRNQNIMKKLTMVSGNDIVDEFKTRSELFRNGQLNAQKYYDYCKRVLGANFEDFFPEMLVLLPDIEKQGALFAVHTGKSRKNLIICENCKQVVMKKELSEHYKYHTFENMFSSQVTPQVNNNNSAWSNKKILYDD